MQAFGESGRAIRQSMLLEPMAKVPLLTSWLVFSRHMDWKVGLYTSPHYKDFRERVKVNGSFISKKEVVEFVEKNKVAFESIQPSFFEWTVALAFHHLKIKR
ncbi:MAG: hypothetical protein R2769_02280 [Saprospiraceae bacterium]